MGTLAGLSLFLSTAAIPAWEGDENTLDCLQGSCAIVLEAGAGWSVHGVHLAVRRTHGITYSCSEALCQHPSSSSEEMPADAAGLLSHDYWAALEASPGSFI